MHILKNMKAVSTFTSIILVLCSLIFGAFISYLWVMASYYNMPENTALLIVEDVVFPVFNARYFNVTILNPSNSISDINITAIRLSVEGKNKIYNITATDPPVQPIPFSLKIGARQTFKCKENWSNFAGEIVRIEPVTTNASTKSYFYTTPKVKLGLTPEFDASQSIEFFDLTVKNSADSIINLTISKIMMFGFSINVTPSLPYILSPNQMETFRCYWNWENLRGQKVSITVETLEGYKSVYTTSELPGAVFYIDKIQFDYTDTRYFNLTASNSEDSTATVMLNGVNLTLPDGTTIPVDTIPPLDIVPIPLSQNETTTIQCIWDWNNYRNEIITVKVYSKQGFTTPTKTVKTPPSIVWNITDVKFDLNRIEYFLVNVTNMPCSLQDINITRIELEKNKTSFQSQIIPVGEERLFNCTFNWTKFAGENVNITVYTAGGLNLTKNITLPSAMLEIEKLVFEESSEGLPYVNVTILNTLFSLRNVTITQIVFETENATYIIDGTLTSPKLAPDGYFLTKGANVTIVCPWDWFSHLDENVTIIVQTAEGIQVSKTILVEQPTP